MRKKSRLSLAICLALLLGCSGCYGEQAPVSAPGDPSPAVEETPQPEVIITDIGSVTTPVEEAENEPDYYSDSGDENALLIKDENVALSGILVNKTGDASDPTADFGENAAILVQNQDLVLTGGTVYSNGKQAEGLMAYGLQSRILAGNLSINTVGELSPGVRVSNGGSIRMGQSSVSTAKEDSPALQVYGSFSAEDSKFWAEEGHCLVLEDGATAEFSACELIGERGILYRDDTPAMGKGRLVLAGSLFAAGEDTILQIEDGDLEIQMKGQQLSGRLHAGYGNLTVILEGESVFCGVIDGENPQGISLILDASSIWTVTEDTRVGVLLDTDTTLSNIVSNGFTVYYDSSLEQNAWLESKSHSLPGGGYLVPLI